MSVDVGKMAKSGINQAAEKIAQKIPQLKGKELSRMPEGELIYELVGSDFVWAGGKFMMPNFVARAAPKRGIDFQGSTVLDLNDESIKASWMISDTYNMTHARDLQVNISGTVVPHILAEGEGPVKLPVTVGCKMKAPCYQYLEAPEALTRVAWDNVNHTVGAKVKKELEAKAKAEAKKVAEKVVEKAAEKVIDKIPEEQQDKAKDAVKKLFGR
jgi:hypothetical protein